jgi:hypothetical protein
VRIVGVSDDYLAACRAANAFAHPTRFAVTSVGTAAWLRGRVLAVPDRIMFLVHDPHGRAVGHAGFADASNGMLKARQRAAR